MTALAAYAASVILTFAALALIVWLLMLALDRLFTGVGQSEWSDERPHVRLVSSPQGCRVCGVAGMHTPDCWRGAQDGAA